MKKYIIFDFNGTIIDDVDLCIDILNKMLKKRNISQVSKEKYKEIFTFPIVEYYKKAGLSFEDESFQELAVEFINEYQPRSLECQLYKGITDCFEVLKKRGYSLILLSASEIKNLIHQTNHFMITEYFDEILGLDNIHASSKVDIAKDFIKKNKITGSNCVFIGDTLHDMEVAKEVGSTCYLISNGHQSFQKLSVSGNIVLKDINEILNILL